MGKKTKTIEKQKQQHYFYLKGSKNTFYKNKIQVDFTPSKNSSIMPIFNKDLNFFTPSFIVPSLYYQNQVDYQKEHQKKIQATAEKSEQNILVPRPRPNKSYCGVCGMQYKDYLQHVKSDNHKSSLKKSEFYKEIGWLCQKVKAQKQQRNFDFVKSINSKSTINSQNNYQEQTASKQSQVKGETFSKQTQIMLST